MKGWERFAVVAFIVFVLGAMIAPVYVVDNVARMIDNVVTVDDAQGSHVARCPEDAMLVGGTCVARDDFGVCRVMQRWAGQVYDERATRRAVEVALAFEARDLACTWQHDRLQGMLR